MNNCTFKHIFFTQLCTQNCQIHKVRLLFIYNLTPCNSHAKSYSYFLLKSHLVNYVVLIELNAIKQIHQRQKAKARNCKYTQFRNTNIELNICAP